MTLPDYSSPVIRVEMSVSKVNQALRHHSLGCCLEEVSSHTAVIAGERKCERKSEVGGSELTDSSLEKHPAR